MTSIDRFSADAARSYIASADTTRASAPEAASGQPAASEGGRRPDSITLSTNALQLAAARAAVQNVPDIRDTKVAAIKLQVDSGTYSVPAHVLARKMVEAAKTTT